jgi:histidinol-phosphate phosphatase family protein
MRKCVFFDRDGIVNRAPGDGRYVRNWRGFRLLPGFVDVLRLARARGYEAVVVTNQRGVARGLMTQAAVDDIHARLRRALSVRHGLALLDVLCCPHEEGTCGCRKPRPGMLLTAAAEHGIDLKASWMVGDHESDIEAGQRAGCRTVLVGAGDGPSTADYRVSDLAALRTLLARLL